MMTLFKYMYYRIARVTRTYGSWGKHFGLSDAFGYLFACLILNGLLLLMALTYWFFEIPPSKVIEFFCKYLLVPLLIVIFFSPVDRGELYNQLDKKYKDEKHQSLKGWCIVLYMVGSVVSFIVFMIASMQHT